MKEKNQNSASEFTELSPESEIVHQSKFVDYQRLEELLSLKKWREADEETANRMLEVSGRTEEDWLRVEDIDNFPCEDLRTIDQLWVKYSNRRFGFSVQKHIYQSLGGTREYNEEAWKAFGERVGWCKNGKWLDYSNLSFDISAQQGHLPIKVVRFDEGGVRIMLCVWFFSRIETCKL